MPIAFQRMKQFESLGQQLQGVAAGARADAVMRTGVRDIMRTTGTVIVSSPDWLPKASAPPVNISEDDEAEEDEEYFLPRFNLRFE